ncbi:acyltransferase family protein [Vibrio breoganii]
MEGSFWSLYVEVCFYFITGLLYFCIGRKWLLSCLVFIALVSGLLITFSDELVIHKIIYGFGFNFYFWFCFGCYLYERVNNRCNWLYTFTLSITFILMLISEGVYLQKGLLLVCLCGMFYSSFYFFTIRKFLSNSLLLYLGMISYPLYLIHENTIIAILRQSYVFFDDFNGFIFTIMSAISIIFMVLIARMIEVFEVKATFWLRNFEETDEN